MGLEFPGEPERNNLGFACEWKGKEFATIVSMAPTPIAAFEASHPGGKRYPVAGRRTAYVAKGGTEYPGLCDVALDIPRMAVVDVLLTRYDGQTEVACLNAVVLATLLHPCLPGA